MTSEQRRKLEELLREVLIASGDCEKLAEQVDSIGMKFRKLYIEIEDKLDEG